MNAITTPMSRRSAVVSSLAAGTLATMAAHSQAAVNPTTQATIGVDGAVTTLVNILTVEPANQARLIDVLNQGIDTMFSKMPGWISSAVIKSRSERQVIIYSQWRDASDIAAFRKDPALQPYFQRISALATQEVFLGDVTCCLHA
ncbi:hypothetical protein BH11PSE7_BH11PSE7_13650 [soil metagenome]